VMRHSSCLLVDPHVRQSNPSTDAGIAVGNVSS
jgi:hypothetical protein